MKVYCGNTRPYLYTLFADADRAEAEAIMQALSQKGHSLWYGKKLNRKNLAKAAALLVVISPAIADSEDLKLAVSLASREDKPILAVFLEGTPLSPGLTMILGSIQGVLRWKCATRESFLEKICDAPLLGELSITAPQKAAAKKATVRLALWGIAAAMAAVAAIALPFWLGEKVDANSKLGRLGLSGVSLNAQSLYFYGETLQEDYSLYTRTAQAGDFAVRECMALTGSGQILERGQLSNTADFLQFAKLKQLCLAGNNITNVTPLASLSSLELLDLSGNPFQAADLSPLASLPKLQTLNLAYTFARDYSFLEDCPALTTLYVTREARLEGVNLGNIQVIYLNAAASDFESLKNACKDEAVACIYLTGNITIPQGETLTIPAGKQVWARDALRLENNGSLEIAGTLSGFPGSLVNNGTLALRQKGLLSLEGQAAENHGDFRVEANATVAVWKGSALRLAEGSFQNSGQVFVDAGGVLQLEGGSIANSGSITVIDGKLIGDADTVTGSSILVTIPEKSPLRDLGITENALDVRTLYVYGRELKDGPTDYQWYRGDGSYNFLYIDAEPLRSGHIEDITDFSRLTNVTALSLAANLVRDYAPLVDLKKLTYLDLSGSPDTWDTDLRPLAELPRLETLNLAFTNVQDLSPLGTCPSLKTLYLTYDQAHLLDGAGLADVEVIFLGTKAETYEQLQAAVLDPDVHHIYMEKPFAIPEGESLTIPDGLQFILASGGREITIDGTLIVGGGMQVRDAAITNKGQVQILDGGELELNNGRFTNRAAFTADYGSHVSIGGAQFLQEDGQLINRGSLHLGTLHYNDGSLENHGFIDVHGGSFFGNGNTVTGKGHFYRDGNIEYNVFLDIDTSLDPAVCEEEFNIVLE